MSEFNIYRMHSTKQVSFKYLRGIIYGNNDGIIITFAIDTGFNRGSLRGEDVSGLHIVLQSQ